MFAKVWIPNGPFAIQADYEEFADYQPKKALVENFLREMRDYMRKRRVFSTDDENVTMDLVVVALTEKGHQVARNSA